MLRITVEDEFDHILIKLEGKLAGAWVTELEEAWRFARAGLEGRSLYLDLNDVDHVDRAGSYLLALLQQSGTQLIASGVSMLDLVLTLERDWPGKEAQ